MLRQSVVAETFRHGEVCDMDVRKKTPFPSTSKMSYRVSNFLEGLSTWLDSGLVPLSSAVCSYNFDFSGGSLKSGIGFKDGLLSFFDESFQAEAKTAIDGIGSIIKIFVYRAFNKDQGERSDKLLLLSSNLSLFILDLEGGNTKITRVRDIIFSSIPDAISYRLDGEDVLIFVSETDNMVVYNGKDMPYEVLDAPRITSADIHFERLFVTTVGEKSQVLFSDDLDPTNWSIDLSEAGFIEMVDERGALNRVISFADYLYIFRDYGISRLTAFGDQEGFSVSHLFVSSAKIFPETVAVCGDHIMFLASNGIYAFDGYSATKVLPELSGMYKSNNDLAHGAYFKGKYYVSLNMAFDERDEFDETGFLNNCLFEYDIKLKKYRISRGVDIAHICPICVGGSEKLLLCARTAQSDKYHVVELDESSSFLGEPLTKVWKTDFYGFGKKHKNKCMRSISVETLGDVVINIFSDRGESQSIVATHGANTYNVMLFGSKFAFEFVGKSADAKVLSPELLIMIGGTD